MTQIPKTSTASSTASPLNVDSTEVRPKSRRRTFSTKEKLRILRAPEKITIRGELGALLRQEGLYYATLQKWREQLAENGESGLSKVTVHRTPSLQGYQKFPILLVSGRQASPLTQSEAYASDIKAMGTNYCGI